MEQTRVSIASFLEGQGWKKSFGPNFYYPKEDVKPHLHLKFANSEDKVVGWAGVRKALEESINTKIGDKTLGYFGVTFEEPDKPVDLMDKDNPRGIRAALGAVRRLSGADPAKLVLFTKELAGHDVQL